MSLRVADDSTNVRLTMQISTGRNRLPGAQERMSIDLTSSSNALDAIIQTGAFMGRKSLIGLRG